MTNNNTTAQPNKKKATNRDVAKLAGVSIATVSYVINGREDQHISEETKEKVLHAINFLNYSPNVHAVGLNTPQPQTIVLRSSSSVSQLTENEILFFMRALNPLCKKQSYQLNYTMNKGTGKIYAHACICFDMSNEEFHALSNKNFIPIIAIDCLINDPVFYQINSDYKKINRAAAGYFKGEDFVYCCIEPHNLQVKEDILTHFKKVLFVNSSKDLRKNAESMRNIAVSQPTLAGLLANEERRNVFFYDGHLAPRAEATLDCIRKAIGRLDVSDEDHYIKI